MRAASSPRSPEEIGRERSGGETEEGWADLGFEVRNHREAQAQVVFEEALGGELAHVETETFAP